MTVNVAFGAQPAPAAPHAAAPAYAVSPLDPAGLLMTATASAARLPGIADLRRHVEESRIVVVRGASIPPELDLSALSELAESTDGPGTAAQARSFDVYADAGAPDGHRSVIRSHERLPFHWDLDGGAAEHAPRFVAYYCVTAPEQGSGGQTLFCDTTRLLALCPESVRDRLAALRMAVFRGKSCLESWPLVQPHPVPGRGLTLRVVEPAEASPAGLRFVIVGTDDPASAAAEIVGLLYDPRYCYRHEWERGDLVIIDNRSVLHARQAFAHDSPRRLRRILIP